MDRLEVIEALKAMPYDLQRLLAAIPESRLREEQKGEASAATALIQRLYQSAELWHKRLFMVWSMADPSLPASIAVADPDTTQMAELVPRIRERRLETVALLDHAVDWTRCGYLPGRGRRSLKQLAELAVAEETSLLAELRHLAAVSA